MMSNWKHKLDSAADDCEGPVGVLEPSTFWKCILILLLHDIVFCFITFTAEFIMLCVKCMLDYWSHDTASECNPESVMKT